MLKWISMKLVFEIRSINTYFINIFYSFILENKRRIKVSEENGELRIVIKTENEAPRTRRRLEEMARDNLECEPATSNLVLADLQCEKCFSSISMKNKLELESLLFQNEDTDFKKEINDRLVNIENLLIRLTNSR